MKKQKRSRTSSTHEQDLAQEYRFDYARSRPNRFASDLSRDAVVVVLDPDVAEVFCDPSRVNAFLRAAIVAVEGDRVEDTG